MAGAQGGGDERQGEAGGGGGAHGRRGEEEERVRYEAWRRGAGRRGEDGYFPEGGDEAGGGVGTGGCDCVLKKNDNFT